MTAPKAATANSTPRDEFRQAMLVARSGAGAEFQTPLARLTRHVAVFENDGRLPVLRQSEALASCVITLPDGLIYSGGALVRSQMHDGVQTLCELSLAENGWQDAAVSVNPFQPEHIARQFNDFINTWARAGRIEPEIKIIVADLQSLLDRLRLWTEQIELGLGGPDAAARDRRVSEELGRVVFPFLDELFDRLERATAALDPDRRPAHAAHLRRQLQPQIVCSPFAARAIHKPLGYAGDYGIVNMILDDPHAGDSLYARLLNRWFIKQPPAEAHRNRIQYLTQRHITEAARCAALGRGLRVYNLGCGPAREVREFMAAHPASSAASFTLVDFNEETLAHARDVLLSACGRHGRQTKLDFQKKSVAQVLRTRDGGAGTAAQHDMVICAGLFDYLSDAACARLMEIFYDMVAPGGLLLVTNVDRSNPIRHWLEDVLEWSLIYRSGAEMLALQPRRAAADGATACADAGTGVNIFLEVRKPA